MAYPSFGNPVFAAPPPDIDFPFIETIPRRDDPRVGVHYGRWQFLPTNERRGWWPFSQCKGCPSLYSDENPSGHKALAGVHYFNIAGDQNPFGPDYYSQAWVRLFAEEWAARLSWIHYAAVGMPGADRNAPTYFSDYFSWVVLGNIGGTTYRLNVSTGGDPRHLLTQMDGGVYISITPGMVVSHRESNRMAILVSYDLSGISQGYFDITLTHPLPVATGQALDLWIDAKDPEGWQYPAPSVSMWVDEATRVLTNAQVESEAEPDGDFEGWIELKNLAGDSCRIAYPYEENSEWKATFRVVERLAGGGESDITASFLSAGQPNPARLVVTHDSGGNFQTFAKIIPSEHCESTEIFYCPESDSNTSYRPTQAMCKHCRRDHSNSIHTAAGISGIGSHQGGTWFCNNRVAAGSTFLSRFAAGRCYQTSCPGFEINEPYRLTSQEFYRYWLASNLYHQFNGQDWVIGRGGGNPSVCLLAGMDTYNYLYDPGAYSALFYGNGVFGYYDSAGDWQTKAIDYNLRGILAWANGTTMFRNPGPHPATSGQNRMPFIGGTKPINWSASSPDPDWYYNSHTDPELSHRAHGLRRLPNAASGSAGLPASTRTGTGENIVQRVKQLRRHFPKLNPANTTTHQERLEQGKIIFGDWTHGGRRYGAKLEVFPPGYERDVSAYTHNAPTVWKASVSTSPAGHYYLTLQFRPETLSFAYWNDENNEASSMTAMAAGNAVDPPNWLRCRNAGMPTHRNKFGGDYDKAHDGATIRILGAGYNDYRLTVIYAGAHTGATYTGAGASSVPLGPGQPIDPATGYDWNGFDEGGNENSARAWRLSSDVVICDLSDPAIKPFRDALIAALSADDGALSALTVEVSLGSVFKPRLRKITSGTDSTSGRGRKLYSIDGDPYWPEPVVSATNQATGEETTLTAGTLDTVADYDIDRASGTVYFDYDLVQTWSSQTCIIIDAPMFDRSDSLDPASIYATSKAIEALTRDGAIRTGIIGTAGRLSLVNKRTGGGGCYFLPTSATWFTYWLNGLEHYQIGVGGGGWQITSYPVPDSQLLYCHGSAAYGCSVTGALVAGPGYEDEGVAMQVSSGSSTSVSMGLEIITGLPVFGASSQLYALAHGDIFNRVDPQYIRRARVEVKAAEANFRGCHFYFSGSSAITDVVNESGGVISMQLIAAGINPATSAWEMRSYGTGIPSALSTDTWTDLDLTQPIKDMLANNDLETWESLYITLAGPHGALHEMGRGSFEDLVKPWVEEHSYWVDGFNPSGLSFGNRRWETKTLAFFSTGLSFRNVKVEIDCPNNLPRVAYGPRPSLLV